MAETYSITIRMSPETATGLRDGGYFLHGFHAVRGPSGGVPLAWFKTDTYSVDTDITWTEAYHAYAASADDATENLKITASAPTPIQVGQVLTITSPTGVGTVSEPPSPGSGATAITIKNATDHPFTAGLSQALAGGEVQPLCSFPLQGNSSLELVPVPQVLLRFATDAVTTGTTTAQGFSQYLMVDLTSASDRTVEFDRDNGWTPQSWATIQPVDADIAPLLTGRED